MDKEYLRLQDYVNEKRISTVLIDIAIEKWTNYYETMVFDENNKAISDYSERYDNIEEARRRHNYWVERIKIEEKYKGE